MLSVFTNGVPRVPTIVIFRGKGEILEREKEKYHPGVQVEFNQKAYMNDQLFLQYIEKHLVLALGGRPSLFVIDLMELHKTSTFLEKLPTHNISTSLIPGGCTGVTGLFLSNESTIEPAVDLLALVLREASRDRWLEG